MQAPPHSAPAVVLDTNVVLDWWVFGDAQAAPLVAALAARRIRWHASAVMLAELDAVLARPLVQRWEPARERALTLSRDEWIVPAATPAASPPGFLCSDASDQPFIDLALQLPARWLVTRDRALLALAQRAAARGLAIVTPARWPAGRSA